MTAHTFEFPDGQVINLKGRNSRGCKICVTGIVSDTPILWIGPNGTRSMTLAEFERSHSSSSGLLNDSYDCYRFRKTIGGYELFFAAEPNKGKGMTIVNAAATRKPNCKGCGANYYDTCQWVGRSIRRCSECPGGLFAEVE